MGRTVSFRGAAAKAFMSAQMGEKPATEDDKLERIATFVYGHVKSGDMAGAKILLKMIVDGGLDRAAEAVTAKRGGA